MFCTETGGTSYFFLNQYPRHVLRSPVTSSGPKLTGTHQCSGFPSCNPRCGHPSTAMSLLIACQSKRVTSFSLMMAPCWCYQYYCPHYFNSSIICWNHGDDINYTALEATNQGTRVNSPDCVWCLSYNKEILNEHKDWWKSE